MLHPSQARNAELRAELQRLQADNAVLAHRVAREQEKARHSARGATGLLYAPLSWQHALSMATHPQLTLSMLFTGARLGAGPRAPRDGARARDGARLQPRLRYRLALLLLPSQPRAELHLRHTCDDLAAAAHPALLTRPPPPRELIGRALREV